VDSGPLQPEVKVYEETYRTTITILKHSSSSLTLDADSILHAEVIDALHTLVETFPQIQEIVIHETRSSQLRPA
jgi:hypothetical protein